MKKIGLSTDQINAIKAVFEKYPAIASVHIYGSRAKGNFSARSDLDLVAYGDTLTRFLIAAILLDLDDLDIPVKIELQDYKSLSNRDLIDHIDRASIEIFTQ